MAMSAATNALPVQNNYKKQPIPKALREQVWIKYCGDKYFKHKCYVGWCRNLMSPFFFDCGHNLPESKGGKTEISNLRPICASCNRSMADNYTIDEFSALSRKPSFFGRCFSG